MDFKGIYNNYHESNRFKVMEEINRNDKRIQNILSLVEKEIEPKLNKNQKILDLGCGFGFATDYLNNKGFNIEGLDISDLAVKMAKLIFKKSRFYNWDIEKQATDRKYNVIFMLDVFEHLFDYKKALNNIFNSLEDNGVLYLHLPCVSSLKNRFKFMFGSSKFLDEDYYHIRHFNLRTIKHELQLIGFKDIKIKTFGKLIGNLNGTMFIETKAYLNKGKPNISYIGDGC